MIALVLLGLLLIVLLYFGLVFGLFVFLLPFKIPGIVKRVNADYREAKAVRGNGVKPFVYWLTFWLMRLIFIIVFWGSVIITVIGIYMHITHR